MNRPSKHLGPLSLDILLPSVPSVTRPTSSVFELQSCHYERKATRQLVATLCRRPTSCSRWWPSFVLHLQTWTNTLVQIITAPKTTRRTPVVLPRRSRRPSNWPVLSSLAIRYALPPSESAFSLLAGLTASIAALGLAPSEDDANFTR